MSSGILCEELLQVLKMSPGDLDNTAGSLDWRSFEDHTCS